MSQRSRGQKARTNETKIAILDFLANGRFTTGDIRGRLAELCGIEEERGIRKHLSELYEEYKFLERIDKIGDHTIWWLKDDFGTFRKIIFFIYKNQHNIQWDLSEFTHNTSYGLSHINNELVSWLLEAGLVKKWYKTFKNKIPQKRDMQKTDQIVLGMPQEQLLLAVKCSPSVLLFLLDLRKIKFLSEDRKYYYEFSKQIMSLLLRDIMMKNIDTFDAILTDNNFRVIKPKHEHRQGLLIKCEYEMFPKSKFYGDKSYLANS